MSPDLTDLSWDRLDALVDTDPLKLRDVAYQLAHEHKELTDSLTAIRDIAYRAGAEGRQDALEAIHARASRTLQGDPQ